jgi:hypothetical protein
MNSELRVGPTDAEVASAVWAALDGRRSLTLDDIQVVGDVLAADACEYLNDLILWGYVKMMGIRGASGGEALPLFRTERGAPLAAPRERPTMPCEACNCRRAGEILGEECKGPEGLKGEGEQAGDTLGDECKGPKGPKGLKEEAEDNNRERPAVNANWLTGPIGLRTRLRHVAETFGGAPFSFSQLMAETLGMELDEAAVRQAVAMLVHRLEFTRDPVDDTYVYIPTALAAKARAYVKAQAGTGKWFSAWMIDGVNRVQSTSLLLALNMARLDGLRIEVSETRHRTEGYSRRRYRVW